MTNSKKWSMTLLLLTLALLVLLGSLTAIVDPFFHYHGPFGSLQYPLEDQRYENDGIVRHFDYDALITGTSLTENFLASQFDRLFGVDSIKVCFSGATYHELNNNLRRAISANPDLRLVLFGLDSWFFFEEKDQLRTDAAYPMYLYDDNLLNDVEYLLNKEVLCRYTARVLTYTRDGGRTTDFDAYGYWGGDYGYGQTGRDIALLNAGPRTPLAEKAQPLSQQERQQMTENLMENAVALARENPDIQFLYFFPPYSILYWDNLVRSGTLDRQMEAWILATELLLEEPNIRLYSFYTDTALSTNLDNYRDSIHYGHRINDSLLERMVGDENLLTKETYSAHWQAVADFYSGYDYDAIYQ